MDEIKKLEYAKQICHGAGAMMVVLPLVALILSVMDKCIGRACFLDYTNMLIGGTIFMLGIVLILAGFFAGRMIKEMRKENGGN